jgi:membrane protease YdiL (CAAX protease family)
MSEASQLRTDAGPLNAAPPAPLAATQPGEPRPPRVWTSFALWALALGCGILAAGIAIALITLRWHGPEALRSETVMDEIAHTPEAVVISSLVLEMTLLLAALTAAGLSPEPWRRRLGLLRPRLAPAGYAVALLGTLAVGQFLESILTVAGLSTGPAIGALTDVIVQSDSGDFVWIVVVFSIGAGVAEELLCRGYIQTRLSRRWGPATGIFVAALLFGLMHLDPAHSAMAAVLGVFLGLVAQWSGSVLPVILCHALNNGISVCMTRFLPEIPMAAHRVLLPVGAVVIAACMLGVWRLSRPRASACAETTMFVAEGSEAYPPPGPAAALQTGGARPEARPSSLPAPGVVDSRTGQPLDETHCV